jgi:CPA1 family monovalent cation:H+ antiporter
MAGFRHIYLELLEQQRKLLNGMNIHADVNEDVIRKYLSLVDVENISCGRSYCKGSTKAAITRNPFPYISTSIIGF